MNKITVNKLPKSRVEIVVEIAPEDFARFEEKALELIARDFEIAGFRKGAAPKDVVKKRAGQEKILDRAAMLAVEASFPEAVGQNSLTPLGYPEVSILKLAPGNPFEYKAVVAVYPQAVLPDYKKIAAGFEIPKIEITEEDIKRLKMEKERHAREHLRQDLLADLAKNTQAEIPDILIEQETQNTLARLKEKTPQVLNMAFEDYLKKLGKTEEQLKNEIARDNEEKIKSYLVLQEIAKNEKIEISDEEIGAAIKKEIPDGQDRLTAEEEGQAKAYWRQNLQTEKVFEFLEANSNKRLK